ncbi:ABC transporter ATP-binding protein [Marivita sp. S0852]|uniref:ABC transporter ATP-binding protein n=1 Tax=Marivita sp. S0852 TaxID=3373893 RepID=UPI003982B461
MSLLSLSGVGHAYLGRTVLEDITLSIAPGELVALVGPSGCGKSTLAHVAAGLLVPRTGQIARSYNRHAMIFQEPRLMPWATAAQNIGFALRLTGLPRNQRKARITEAAERVALEKDDLRKYPSELSGGMKQRVAIARALSVRPDFIFFDEPFTALDVALRRRMQDLVIRICADDQVSGLFITHDLFEAARLADRIAVLDTKGQGLPGERRPPGAPQDRSDRAMFDWVQSAMQSDPLFRHIHDVDERRLA